MAKKLSNKTDILQPKENISACINNGQWRSIGPVQNVR